MPDAKQKDDEVQKDEQGNEIDMSPHIPEDQDEVVARTDTNDMSLVEVDEDDLNQDPKTNDLDGGVHPTSATFGMVYSDYATDGAGNGPEEFSGMGITDPDEVDAPELNSPATKKSGKREKAGAKN